MHKDPSWPSHTACTTIQPWIINSRVMAFQRMENRTLSVPVSRVAGGGLMSECWQMRDVQKPTKESAFSWIKKILILLRGNKRLCLSFCLACGCGWKFSDRSYDHKTKGQNGRAESPNRARVPICHRAAAQPWTFSLLTSWMCET